MAAGVGARRWCSARSPSRPRATASGPDPTHDTARGVPGPPRTGPAIGPPAARRAAGQPAAPRRGRASRSSRHAGRSDPLFGPAAEPTPGVTTPRVAHLRLGGVRQARRRRAGARRRAEGRAGRRRRGRPAQEQVRPHARPSARPTPTCSARSASPGRATRRRRSASPCGHHVPGKGWSGWQAAAAASADRDPDGPADQAGPAAATGRDPAAADRREPAPAWRRGTDLVWLGTADGDPGERDRPARARRADVVVDLIDPMTAPGDEAAGAAGTTPPGPMGPFAAPPPAPGDGRVPMPAIAHRGDWGADERLMDWSPVYARPVKAVALHHTATANSYEPVDVPRILRAIYYFQAVSPGLGRHRVHRCWSTGSAGCGRAATAGWPGRWSARTRAASTAYTAGHRPDR